MIRMHWLMKGVTLLICTGAVAGTQYPQTNVLTSGVAVEADRCLPPNAVDVMFDERSVTAIDSASGSAVHRFEGESLRKVGACGNVALFVTDRQAGFYSTRTGRWQLRSVHQSDNAAALSKSYNFSLGQNIVILATSNEIFFYHADKGSLQSVALNADRLRAVAGFDDTGCAVTDRHVYCTTGQAKTVQQFALHDMHIRSLSAQSGKIIMRAPEKTLIFYTAQLRFEYLPLR